MHESNKLRLKSTFITITQSGTEVINDAYVLSTESEL